MDELLKELQKLVGRNVEYEGVHCQVIEVLAQGPEIVLEGLDADEIQANQFGEAHRRVPKTYSIPLSSGTDDDLHPVMLALLDTREVEIVRTLLTG